jgi:hypothetical protein
LNDLVVNNAECTVPSGSGFTGGTGHYGWAPVGFNAFTVVCKLP